VSQLQSVSLFVAIGSRLVAARLGLVAIGLRELQLVRQVAIGSRRVAIGLSSCNWFSCEVATAGSVYLLYRMHLGAF
jgi:hypothetical protein